VSESHPQNVEIAPDSGWDSQQLAAVFAEVFVSP